MFRRKIKKSIHKIAAAIMSALLVLIFLFPSMSANAPRAWADSDKLTMDETAVEEDIKGIDYLLYPKIPGAEPKLYSFQEYAFSDDPFKQGNYALYIYVYNPSCTEYVQFNGASALNMASDYAREEDGTFALTSTGELTPTVYKNFSLKYCGATDGEKENLFVKFRVMNVGEILENVKAMDAQELERRYDVVGMQLFEQGADNATDYQITKGGRIDSGGRTYFFSGYAKGLSEFTEGKSSLTCRYEDLGTVDLDVYHTSYKTGVSSLGRGHQNELHTVYFSVDNRFLEAYGRLQKIAAQWYEYKLTPSIVASAEIYEKLLPYVGVDIGVNAGDKRREDLPYSISHNVSPDLGEVLLPTDPTRDYTWNCETSLGGASSSTYVENVLKLLFKASALKAVNDYTVKGADVLEAAKTYAGVTSGETLPIKDGTVPADCFLGTVEDGRTRGYNFREFDADNVDDQWDLLSYNETHNGWDKFWDYFFSAPDNLDETILDIVPIYQVTDEDIAITKDSELASTLLIDEGDADALRTFYWIETAQNKSVFLFRFAATDYYAVPLQVYDLATHDYVSSQYDDANINAELRQGTAFLDFEVISLTFNDNGALTVIGVCSSPIDFVGNYTPAVTGSGCCKDFRKLLAILPFVLIGGVVIYIIDTVNQRHKLNTVYRSTKKKK